MARDSSDYLGKELATLKQQVKQLQKGRLGNASMHGGALPYYDDEGNLRAIFGDQGDGSWGAGVVSSPPQPTPTAPLVVQVDKFGRASATWDGEVVSGQVPRVHGRVDVYSAFSSDGSEPGLSEYQVAATIWEREGGMAPIVCPAPGIWFVRLQMVGADERTKGAMSDPSTVDIEGLVDTEAIEAELAEARDRITEADERLTEGQAELDNKIDTVSKLASDLTGTGITTFIQATEPPAMTGDPGDLGVWINTAENDARYWWDHEQAAWVPVPDDGEFLQLVADEIFARVVYAKMVETQGLITEDMIATGAITTPKLSVTEEMTAELAQFLVVHADQIAANAIDGMTITGSIVQTSSNWSSDGGAIMRQNGALGNFVAVNNQGQIVARLGGARNELANLRVDGDITARSVALTGELRVGTSGNGEGGLVPDNGRIRLQGRIPRAEASARDLLTTGTTSAMNFSASDWVNNNTAVRTSYTITYATPAPTGNRFPLVTAHGDTPNMAGPTTVTSRAMNPGQFQAVVRSAGPSGTHGDVRVRYLSVWADSNA